MNSLKNSFLRLEHLEERDCPAPLTFQFDGLGNLRISGMPDPAGLTIDIAAPNSYTITDGANVIASGWDVPGSLSIFTNSPTDDLVFINIDSGASIGGNLYVDTSTGNDAVSITGFDPSSSIAGNVTVNNSNLFSMFSTSVGGFLTVNSFRENLPFLGLIADGTVGGNLTLMTGNNNNIIPDIASIATTLVGGSTYVNMQNGVNSYSFDALSSIGTGFTYLGGSGDDFVIMNGTIGGGANVQLGTSLTTNDFLMAPTALVGGSLSVTGGLGADNLSVEGFVGGSSTFNLGSGTNVLYFNAASSGSSFYYMGGTGTDDVTIDAASDLSLARATVILGAGDDTFTLNSSLLSYLYVDFGVGTDTFNNGIGFFPFPAYLRNLP